MKTPRVSSPGCTEERKFEDALKHRSRAAWPRPPDTVVSCVTR